ncbi:SDR family NAD(P)-dependent oxidoreductase [Roseospirillum parvum]|uniref:Short-chain dehydrogenase n=1 Tax=Roseospirillum parvum TaxID=83401 RepID=A0A1G7XX20_9PROT|nr:SDR family NAD(P)-dependent oxidoreductase [Roseospirillum parvum]SDG88752.1 Short-chain dehydrogenase [Roseospirillum parvum]
MTQHRPSLAWITGASTGIGRAVARRLAAQGWTVIASARGAEGLEKLAAETPNVVPWRLDVTDPEACARAVAGIEEAHGPIELAILNAGTHQPMGAADYDPAVAARVMGLNYQGTANSLAPVMAAMRKRGRGRIGLVASVAGYRGLPTAAAYAPSKAAVIALAESLAPELAADGVGLSVINPGFVKTPLTDRNDFPMPFLIEAEAAARHIVDGLDKGRFEIVFPWPMLAVFAIAQVLPRRWFLFLVRKGIVKR